MLRWESQDPAVLLFLGLLQDMVTCRVILSYLKAAVTCLVIFAELGGLCEVLVRSSLLLPFPQAH